MVQAINEGTTSGAHKGVLQGTEQNPVQLLHIMLICPLKVHGDYDDYPQLVLVHLNSYSGILTHSLD